MPSLPSSQGSGSPVVNPLKKDVLSLKIPALNALGEEGADVQAAEL